MIIGTGCPHNRDVLSLFFVPDVLIIGTSLYTIHPWLTFQGSDHVGTAPQRATPLVVSGLVDERLLRSFSRIALQSIPMIKKLVRSSDRKLKGGWWILDRACDSLVGRISTR